MAKRIMATSKLNSQLAINNLQADQIACLNRQPLSTTPAIAYLAMKETVKITIRKISKLTIKTKISPGKLKMAKTVEMANNNQITRRSKTFKPKTGQNFIKPKPKACDHFNCRLLLTLTTWLIKADWETTTSQTIKIETPKTKKKIKLMIKKYKGLLNRAWINPLNPCGVNRPP